MNFDLNEEQQALGDSVARLLRDLYSFEQRRVIAASPAGWSDSVWRALADLGVTALSIPEESGGLGGGARDLLPVMESFGRALLLEPFLASTVLGATAVRLAGRADARKALLSAVATGSQRLAWAHDEAGARHAPLWIETTALRVQGRWRIDGAKINVLHAPAAHQHVVSARTHGGPGEREGTALFLVDARSPGLHCRAHRLVDDSAAAELRYDAVDADPLGDPDDSTRSLSAIDGTLAFATAAVCADAVGAMEAAHRLTMDYLNTRKQFGRLIGENQALRHRAAEMQVSIEMARSMAIAAAVAADVLSSAEAAIASGAHVSTTDTATDLNEAHADLMRAKLIVGTHGRLVCHGAIQLHGGIGMTEEYAVGHYLRRVTLIDQLFGDADAQASRLAAWTDATRMAGAPA